MTKKSKKIISPITEPTHEQLSYILENMHEGIGIVDVNEILTYVNNAFAAQVEETKENLIGKALNEVFDPSLFPFFQKETQKRLSGENSDYEIPFKTKSGATKYYKVYVAPRYDSEGKYIGAIGSMLDITDKFEASRQLIKAKEKVLVTEQTVSQAEENYRVTEEKFRHGLTLNSELLDAEVALVQAKTNYAQSVVDYELAKAQIERATGGK